MKKLLLALFAGVASVMATTSAKTLTVNDLCPLVDESGNRYGQAYTVYYGDFTFDGLPLQTYGDCKITPVDGSTTRFKLSNFGFGQLGDAEFELNSDNTLTLLTTDFGSKGQILKCKFEEEYLYGRAAIWTGSGYSFAPGFSSYKNLWTYSHNATSGSIVSNPVTDMGNDEYDFVFSKDSYSVQVGSNTGPLNPLYFDKIQIHTYTPNGKAKYTVNGPSTGNVNLSKQDVPTRVNLNGNTINIVNFANRGIQYDVTVGTSPEYGDNVYIPTGKYYNGTYSKISDDTYSLTFPRQEVWGDASREVAFFVNSSTQVCPWKIVLLSSSTTGIYDRYYAQTSSSSATAVTGTMTLTAPVHKYNEASRWVHYQYGGTVHTMVGATIKLNNFSVFRTGYNNQFTGYQIDCDDLADMTHDVLLGIDVYGYGTLGSDDEKYIYVRGMLYPDTETSAKYVDGYELMIVPGWHESAEGTEFSHIDGHEKAFNIEKEDYFHHKEYNFKAEESLRHAVSRVSEGKTDEELAKELNEGLKFNRLIPVSDLPYTDPDGHYTLFVKTNYTTASKLHPTYHSLSYVTDSNTTSIESVEELAEAASISTRNGEIVVSGTEENVEVYTLSGVQVFNGQAGTIAVAPGIYMVKAGAQVEKVTVK